METKAGAILCVSVLLTFLILMAGARFAFVHATATTVTIAVQDKERMATRDRHFYLVHGDLESFEVSDELFYLRYGSTDTYRKLERGKTYDVRVCGWRVPFFSWYRNIIKIEREVSEAGE